METTYVPYDWITNVGCWHKKHVVLHKKKKMSYYTPPPHNGSQEYSKGLVCWLLAALVLYFSVWFEYLISGPNVRGMDSCPERACNFLCNAW